MKLACVFLVISVLWVAGGILLLKCRPLGYAGGLGLLFTTSMLFIGLILFMLLHGRMQSQRNLIRRNRKPPLGGFR